MNILWPSDNMYKLYKTLAVATLGWNWQKGFKSRSFLLLTYTIISCLENTQQNVNKIFYEVESEFVLPNTRNQDLWSWFWNSRYVTVGRTKQRVRVPKHAFLSVLGLNMEVKNNLWVIWHQVRPLSQLMWVFSFDICSHNKTISKYILYHCF